MSNSVSVSWPLSQSICNFPFLLFELVFWPFYIVHIYTSQIHQARVVIHSIACNVCPLYWIDRKVMSRKVSLSTISRKKPRTFRSIQYVIYTHSTAELHMRTSWNHWKANGLKLRVLLNWMLGPSRSRSALKVVAGAIAVPNQNVKHSLDLNW